MKICPSCREEYLDHIELCITCRETLVNEIDAQNIRQKGALLSKEELFKSEMVPFLEGSLAHCREIEKVLAKSFVSCAVYPMKLSADANATLGSTSDMKYMLLIRECDVLKAKDALEGKFHDEVMKEGKGAFSKSAVDLSQEEVACPACEHVGALSSGECKNCGLFLGAPENESQKSN
jgi:hypothetical protein